MEKLTKYNKNLSKVVTLEYSQDLRSYEHTYIYIYIHIYIYIYIYMYTCMNMNIYYTCMLIGVDQEQGDNGMLEMVQLGQADPEQGNFC